MLRSICHACFHQLMQYLGGRLRDHAIGTDHFDKPIFQPAQISVRLYHVPAQAGEVCYWEGVTGSFMLSEYLPALKGTYGDTTVYVMEGKTDGPSMLVLGGTHPNEPSGHMAAISLVEHCTVDSGTLYVIPRANNSAFTHNDAQEASPPFLSSPDGQRHPGVCLWFSGHQPPGPVA